MKTSRTGNLVRVHVVLQQGGTMGILKGVAFGFDETMTGFAAVGETDPRTGEARGKQDGTRLEFRVHARMDDMERFIEDARHQGTLTGDVTFAPLGGTFPIRNGRIHLFDLDPDTGVLRMVYAFSFTAADGRTYHLQGQKNLKNDDTGLRTDITHLFTTIHAGEDETAPIHAAGIACFLLRDSASLAGSMRVFGTATARQRIAAYAAFASLAAGSLRDEYLRGWNPLYNATYENLVLSGAVASDDGELPFFLVAGEHSKGFPWGDPEPFSDVLFLLGDGHGGWRRFCVSAPALESLDVRLMGGKCSFDGSLFEIVEGFGTSVTGMEAPDSTLRRWNAHFDITIEARVREAVSFPFPFVSSAVRKLGSEMASALRQVLPETHPLGIWITPHEVTVSSGSLRLSRDEIQENWRIEPDKTGGEGERGTFRSVREPTLLYRYLGAIRPPAPGARVQIRTGVLRDDRENWAKDRLDAYLGSLIDFHSSAEYSVGDGSCTVRRLAKADAAGSPEFTVVGDPLLEVANDHLSTGVFMRRIRQVQDASGATYLALEEDMDLLRREPIGTDRVATVAIAKGDVAIAALDRVLEHSGFDAVIDKAADASGKAREDFAVVIKPNFMFSYSREDRSTFTNPALVARLVERLHARGYKRITVVEAHSTYGEYFQNRGVTQVASYLGYDQVGCPVVDMTEDADEILSFPEPLGQHPVSRTWREADFRISFAKNKTHCYAYYTLTIKNIYGALSLPNKFKEYHCERGIYGTTIEFLKAYPVHFGIIDAWCGADGPFGVFASTAPRDTRTVIGGQDLVAVDWVGATLMGLDPLVSPYMRLAVDAFGKPRIVLDGDPTPYRPWLNVPSELALFTNEGLDAQYHFGNVFYMACSHMDPQAFPEKPGAMWKRFLRTLSMPLRETFFVQTGKNPTLANRLASRLLYRMGF
jgi:cholesterol oxidase